MTDLENSVPPLFSLRAVAAATGWQFNTLRTYLARGTFEWNDGSDLRGQGTGTANRLSLHSAVRLGIAFHLSEISNLTPREAFVGALSFTDIGSTPDSNRHLLARKPGELFPSPFRTLLLWKDGQGVRVVPYCDGVATDIDELLFDPFNGRGDARCAVIEIGRVLESVSAALEAQS